MDLLIIAEKEIERRILKEAFSHTPIDVELYACFKEAKGLDEDSFILVVDALEEARKYTDQRSVFMISDKEIEGSRDFEDVFVRPIRLGHVVEVINQAIRQHVLHKALSPIALGAVTLNPKVSKIFYREKAVRLTEKELAMLIFLSQNKNVPTSRQKLLDEVWGYAINVETHTLETHIYRLRQKLQTQLGLSHFLVTKDDGYVLKF